MLKKAPMYGSWKATKGAGLSEENPRYILSFRYPMMVTYADRSEEEVYTLEPSPTCTTSTKTCPLPP